MSEKDKNWIVLRWNSIRNQLDRLKITELEDCKPDGKTHGAMLSAILLGEKSGLDPEMKKLYQKNGLGTSACNFGITHVADRNVCLPVIKKNGNSFLFSGNCRRRDSVFLFVMTDLVSVFVHFLCFYPYGGKITGEMWINLQAWRLQQLF